MHGQFKVASIVDSSRFLNEQLGSPGIKDVDEVVHESSVARSNDEFDLFRGAHHPHGLVVLVSYET